MSILDQSDQDFKGMNDVFSFGRVPSIFIFPGVDFCVDFPVLKIIKCCLQMSRVLRKPAFRICENRDADQLRGNREADQRLWIVQTFYFLDPKFQASSHLLSLYSLVCVGPGRKPRRPGFSEQGSYKDMGDRDGRYTVHHYFNMPMQFYYDVYDCKTVNLEGLRKDW